MKPPRIPAPALPVLLLPLFASPARAEDPNYVVTGIFHTDSPEMTYGPTDFNNQGMVCGTWSRRPEGGGPELDRGAFLWRDGVMRHISPAAAGLPFIRSAAIGVRMTNVRPDGTLLLVAGAVQASFQSGFHEEIERPIRYTIEADLNRFPQPVVSAEALGGYLDPNWRYQQLTEFSVDSVFDITEDGYVLGESVSPFVAVPRLLWGPAGGNSPRWFDYSLYNDWGVPWGLDHHGTVFGAGMDHRSYETPLAGLSPLGGTSRTFWPQPEWADLEPGVSSASGLNPVAVHGPYRAAHPSRASYQTAVWTTGFNNPTLVPWFNLNIFTGGHGNARNSLTTNGHMLGSQLAPGAWLGGPPAIAIRAVDGTYTVRTQREQLTEGYRLFPPFANPLQSSPNYAPYVSAINDNLQWLAEMADFNYPNGKGFYILSNRPGPGRILPLASNWSGWEDNSLSLSFRRVLGKSGPAELRVTLTSGGTATAGQDFMEGTTGVIRWEDGEAGIKTLELPLLNDYAEEADETLRVVLTEVRGATLEGAAEHLAKLRSEDDPPPGAPVISGAATVSGTVGEPLSYEPEATEDGSNWSATGLPGGVILDQEYGSLSGSPWEAGTFNVTLVSRNRTFGSAPFFLTITVAPRSPADSLVITSPRRATARAGQPFSYQFTVSRPADFTLAVWNNAPDGVFDLLPPGFSYNSATGWLTGTPTAAQVGLLTFSLNASTSFGEPVAVAGLQIDVSPASGPLTAVQQWLLAANHADVPALGDPDGNGLPSLLEYAFGIAPGARPLSAVNPGAQEPAAGIPAFGMDSLQAFTPPRLAVTYYRSRGAMERGLTYTVEFTTDFIHWTASTGGQRMSYDDVGEIIRVADPAPGPLTTSPRSARVRVTQPEL